MATNEWLQNHALRHSISRFKPIQQSRKLDEDSQNKKGVSSLSYHP